MMRFSLFRGTAAAAAFFLTAALLPGCGSGPAPSATPDPDNQAMSGYSDYSEDHEQPGGATTYVDPKAPKTIDSEEIAYFSAEESDFGDGAPYVHLYGYAARVNGGVLAALSFVPGGENARTDAEWQKAALVDEGILARLDAIVKKYGFAESNGIHHSVAGLPEDFGGTVDVEYASGETVSFSDNQSPVITRDAGREIAEVLLDYIEHHDITTRSVADVTAVLYREERDDGSYTQYTVSGNKLETVEQFHKDEKPCEKEYPFTEENFSELRGILEKGCAPHWEGLPEYDWAFFTDRPVTLTLKMKDGSEVLLKAAMRGPDFSRGLISDVYLYLYLTAHNRP